MNESFVTSFWALHCSFALSFVLFGKENLESMLIVIEIVL